MRNRILLNILIEFIEIPKFNTKFDLKFLNKKLLILPKKQNFRKNLTTKNFSI